MIVLLMLVGAAIVYGVLQYLYKRFWNKNLTVSVTFSEQHVTKGEQVELTEVVTNAKRLPLPYINVKFQADRSLDFGNTDTNTVVSDKSYRNDIFSLLFYQKVTRKIPLTCQKRGIFEIDQADLVSSGAFMTDIFVMTQPQNAQITVYPKIADTRRLNVIFQSMNGTLERNRHLYEDKFVFRGIRDYDVHDAMNTINWKASARTGDLMVNQYSETMCQQICILLNLEPEGMNRDDHMFEECISIAAGLAQMFVEQGIQTELISNGLDKITGELTRVYPGGGFSHLNALNTALARIDETRELEDFVPLIESMVNQERNHRLYVMISLNTRDTIQTGYQKLLDTTPGGSGGYWITPVYAEQNRELTQCNAELINWEVSRA